MAFAAYSLPLDVVPAPFALVAPFGKRRPEGVFAGSSLAVILASGAVIVSIRTELAVGCLEEVRTTESRRLECCSNNSFGQVHPEFPRESFMALIDDSSSKVRN